MEIVFAVAALSIVAAAAYYLTRKSDAPSGKVGRATGRDDEAGDDTQFTR